MCVSGDRSQRTDVIWAHGEKGVLVNMVKGMMTLRCPFYPLLELGPCEAAAPICGLTGQTGSITEQRTSKLSFSDAPHFHWICSLIPLASPSFCHSVSFSLLPFPLPPLFLPPLFPSLLDFLFIKQVTYRTAHPRAPHPASPSARHTTIRPSPGQTSVLSLNGNV